MPRLTDEKMLDALREKCAGMKGTPTQIAAALNAPEVLGYEAGTIETGDAYEALSAATMLALDEEAGNGGAHAGEALWFIAALADVERLSLAEGGRGAGTLEALSAAGIIPEAERDALIAAAQVEVTGPSWGQQAGIGQIETAWVQEVLG